VGEEGQYRKLCAVGYLLYLAFLYGIGATQGPDSMGYGWLSLLAFTLPWSFLFDPIAGQGLHVGGVAGMVLNFALLVGLYGGMNSLLFVGVVWMRKRKPNPESFVWYAVGPPSRRCTFTHDNPGYRGATVRVADFSSK
jgi:hypothetical protein